MFKFNKKTETVAPQKSCKEKCLEIKANKPDVEKAARDSCIEDCDEEELGGGKRKSRRNRKSKKGKKSRKSRKSRRKSNRRRGRR